MQRFQSFIALTDRNGAIRNGQRIVGMHAIISCGDIKSAAAHSDRRIGMHRIIRGIDLERTGNDGQISCSLKSLHARAVILTARLFAFGHLTLRAAASAHEAAPLIRAFFGAVHAAAARGDRKSAIQDLHISTCAEAISLCFKRKRPLFDIDKTKRIILVVFGMNAIFAGIDRQREHAGHPDAVIGFQSM